MDAADLKKLLEPFDPEDIEWRVQQSGIKNDKGWAMVLAYVQNRAVQQRLDDVCGAHNWKNKFETAPDSGVMCGLSIKVGDEWIDKWDGAENTQIEAVKGGLSGAMKRAAVQWGIGRYLYKLDTTFVQINARGQHYIGIKEKPKDEYPKIKGYWDDPELPDSALPADYKKTAPASIKEYNPARDEAEKQIRALAVMLGYSDKVVNAKLATIRSSDDAANMIKKLEDLHKKQEDERPKEPF